MGVEKLSPFPQAELEVHIHTNTRIPVPANLNSAQKKTPANPCNCICEIPCLTLTTSYHALSPPHLLVLDFFHRCARRTLCHFSVCCRRGFGACGLGCRLDGGELDGLGLVLVVMLVVVLVVVVMVVVVMGVSALLVLAGLAISFCGELCGLLLLLGLLLGFDVLGSLGGRS
jgi:hypothetical protein